MNSKMTLPYALEAVLNALTNYEDVVVAQGGEAMKDFKRPKELAKAVRMVTRLHARLQLAHKRRAKKPNRPDYLQ